MPKVSIIIPLHNAEDYITETLQSCFDQTHKDVEVIVIENGSSDHSFAKAKVIQDGRLQLYQISKANAAAARNFGIQKATGDFVMFLDADDILSKDKIKLQLKALAEKPEGWLASCAWAKFDTDINHTVIKTQPVWKVEDPVQWCINSWTGGGMMIPGCWLIPKAILKKSGVWNEHLSLHDDGEFIGRVLLASQGQVFVEEACVFYRQVAGSLSRQNDSYEAATSALEVYRSYGNHILAIKDNSAIRVALAHNYSRFIYEFYPNHKKLINEAKQHLNDLGITKPPLIGGQNFKKLAGIVGFYNVLRLRTWFKF